MNIQEQIKTQHGIAQSRIISAQLEASTKIDMAKKNFNFFKASILTKARKEIEVLRNYVDYKGTKIEKRYVKGMASLTPHFQKINASVDAIEAVEATEFNLE